MEKSIFAVYKPKGITSHDVVEKVRKLSKERRVGHGGTLDPFASGILVVAVGREYTKELGNILKNTDKVYRATIRLGARSSTDDPEGEIIENSSVKTPPRKEVASVLKQFEGEIDQLPPAFSAVKIRGKKAYELARKGITPQLRPRKVQIKNISLLHYRWPLLDIEATVSSGTYIRSLARDIGEKLGVGGYAKELERTRVGEYVLENTLRIF